MDSLSKETNRGGGGVSRKLETFKYGGEKIPRRLVDPTHVPLGTINISWLKTIRFISRRCFCPCNDNETRQFHAL